MWAQGGGRGAQVVFSRFRDDNHLRPAPSAPPPRLLAHRILWSAAAMPPPALHMSTHYRGWARPGPVPPGGVDVEPGETLDYISGYFRIFQYEGGHRFSTDDVLTAWYGTQWAPRVARAADLGSGIGSVALV